MMASAAWVLCAITVVSFIQPVGTPRLFQSSHVEHLVALYFATALVMVALPQVTVTRLSLGLGLFVLALEFARIYLRSHRKDGPEDLMCDLAGILLAVAPIFVGRLRSSWAGSNRPQDGSKLRP